MKRRKTIERTVMSRTSAQSFMSSCLPLFLIVSFISTGCMKSRPQNPLDSTPEFTVTIPALESADTLIADTLHITVRGDNEFLLYRYRLDNSAWSAYTDAPDVQLSLLDDGAHTLDIDSRYEGRSTTSEQSFTFFVALLPDIAVYAYPRISYVSGDSNSADFRVRAKNISPCDRMHFVFSGVTVDSVTLPETESVERWILLAHDHIADLIIPPGSTLLEDATELLHVHVTPDTESDTAKCTFTCTARDTTNTAISIDLVRECTIVRQ